MKMIQPINENMFVCLLINNRRNNFHLTRFRNSSPELELKSDIIPFFRDDIQLTVSEYRSKLYEIMSSTERKRK